MADRPFLTRERILSGEIHDMLRRNPDAPTLMTDAERHHWQERLLDERPRGIDGLWVFGYGSLLWNPTMHVAEWRTARIYGFHRRFCLWTHIGRGSRRHPGLVLGLDRGGSCVGQTLRVEERLVESEIDILLRREMLTAAYRPVWVRAHTGQGPVPALSFAINPASEIYAPPMSEAQTAAHIATARGALGPCYDYLFDTVRRLQELHIHDHRLEALTTRVHALLAAG